jgi:hypothetical protein
LFGLLDGGATAHQIRVWACTGKVAAKGMDKVFAIVAGDDAPALSVQLDDCSVVKRGWRELFLPAGGQGKQQR